MSLEGQTQMALAEKKLELLVVLSDEIMALIHAAVKELSVKFATPTIRLNEHSRVLIGLTLKGFAAFESLLIDARIRRSEASHHLKTLAECFIYSRWVGIDTGDTNARLVYAEGCRGMVAYYRNNTESNDSEMYACEWEGLLNQGISGIEDRWREFKTKGLESLAADCNLGQHYQKIYRRACEAAHISDLSAYTPPYPEGYASLAPATVSTLRAYVSLDYGLHIVLDFLRDASDYLGSGLDEKIGSLRERKTAINSLTT
jgi:hypothetical protein